MNFRLFKRLLVVMLLLTGIAQAQESSKKLDALINKLSKNAPAYVFSYFTGDGEDGLHLAYSFDGIYWRALNDGESFLKSSVGKEKLMRDPSIYKDSKGVFHLVWTTGWNDKIIGYAASKDLMNWTDPIEIPVMINESTCKNCWAPEVFYDKGSKKYVIVWASTLTGANNTAGQPEPESNNRLYYTTTKDFVTFSKAALFYNPGFDCIDPFITKQGGKYQVYFKKESNNAADKTIHSVTSGNLFNLPTTVSAAISTKGEAVSPAVIKVGKYTYVYWRNSKNGKLMGVRCDDLKDPEWSDVSNMLRYPANFKQGTAVKIDDVLLTKIQAKRP